MARELRDRFTYWKQFALASSFAVAVFITVATVFNRDQQVAGVIAVGVYIGIRFFVTWFIRTKYWLHRSGHTSQTCGECGEYVHRLQSDWVLTCRRCGWRHGWPVIRWVTHSVPAIQFRRTVWNPKLGIGLFTQSNYSHGRLQGMRRAVFSWEFVVTLILVAGVSVAGGMYVGVIDDEPVSNMDGLLPESESFKATEVEQAIHNEVNQFREEQGLKSVSPNSALDGVARAHSRDMGARDFFAHENPDGQTPYDRVRAQRIGCQAVGENIAETGWQKRMETDDGIEQYTTNKEVAAALVELWINSPPHRKNMLDPQWTTMGVGVQLTDDDTVIATNKFCR